MGDCPETLPRRFMFFELSQLNGRLARDSISYIFGQATECSLRRPLTNSGFCRNFTPGAPLRAEDPDPECIHDHSGPSQALALCAGVSEPGGHPFPDAIAFEFSKGRNDLIQQLAGCCREV